MIDENPEFTRFELLVQESLDSIPAALWNGIDNVVVSIEEWPTPHQLQKVGLRHPSQLLGLYEGVPLTVRRSHYALVAPDKVTIFRQPILRVCRFNLSRSTPNESSPDESSFDQAIRHQVKRTVLHEIAHHFGISDQRLRDLGAY